MIDIISKMFCLVTLTVCVLYATRICWVCGKKCTFETNPDEKKNLLKTTMPTAFAIYSFGFFIIFTCAIDGPMTITTLAITSALLTSHFVVSMAMPTLRRPPSLNYPDGEILTHLGSQKYKLKNNHH